MQVLFAEEPCMPRNATPRKELLVSKGRVGVYVSRLLSWEISVVGVFGSADMSKHQAEHIKHFDPSSAIRPHNSHHNPFPTRIPQEGNALHDWRLLSVLRRLSSQLRRPRNQHTTSIPGPGKGRYMLGAPPYLCQDLKPKLLKAC